MRRRVSSLTMLLPRRARDTVGCETPARCAITSDVAFCLLRMAGSSSHAEHRQARTLRARSSAQRAAVPDCAEVVPDRAFPGCRALLEYAALHLPLRCARERNPQPRTSAR